SHRVQPQLIAFVTSTPYRIRRVRVESGRSLNARPGGLFEGIPVLQDAPALRAFTRRSVHAEAVAGRALSGIGAKITERRLTPPRLDRRLRANDVLIDAPLARGPLENLVGRAGEVAGHARRDLRAGAWVVGSREEAARNALTTRCRIVRRVH